MKQELYATGLSLPGTAWDTIRYLIKAVETAEKQQWTELEFNYAEDGIDLWGKRPPDPEQLAKAKEKRRKQYEKLKQEFGE